MYEIKKTNIKKAKPIYKVVFEYMIGDLDGHTSETIEFDADEFDEEVQNHLHILQKFTSLKLESYWGIAFDDGHLHEALNLNLITQEEHNILKSEFSSGYFSDCIKAKSGYTYLTIQDIDIIYIDENGVKNKVVWKD